MRIRLVSDVPLGAFLSGGLDPAAVVGLMARLMGQSVKTFAIGFEDDPSFNELEYARLAEAYRRTPRVMQAALAHLFPVLPESTRYDSFVRRTRRFVENAPFPLARRYLG